MKKLAFTANLLIILMGAAASSCSDKQAATAPAAVATVSNDSAAPAGLNIRYIDGDSLMAHYNLSKDFREAYMSAL